MTTIYLTRFLLDNGKSFALLRRMEHLTRIAAVLACSVLTGAAPNISGSNQTFAQKAAQGGIQDQALVNRLSRRSQAFDKAYMSTMVVGAGKY